MSKAAYGAVPGGVPPYPGGNPPYPGGNPPYPGGNPPYPGGNPPYPQGAPPYPQSNPAGNPPYPAGNPPYPQGGAPADQDSYQGPVEASCPPLEEMDQVPGYAGVGFEGVALPPPTYEQAVGERPEREIFQGTITITAEDAQEALIEHANSKCCWGAKPARKMTIHDLVSSSAYRYTLETFAESRRTKWSSEPFYGGNVVVTGPAPSPWEIPATPSSMFHSSKVDIEVPNTASVKPCHRCRGRGYDDCGTCMGRGQRTCIICNGSGFRETHVDGTSRREQCSSCRGGMDRCGFCNGTGRRGCRKCNERGNLRWFILLTVKWTNHLDDHVEQRSSLPNELVREVTGQLVLDESYLRVWPVSNCPVREINTRSNELVTLHSTKFTMERILMQRQRIHCVPVTHVHYSLPSQTASFFVYGREHKIHAPDYPAQCCCGCSVL